MRRNRALLLLAALCASPASAAPQIPTGFTGYAASSSQINLTWNPSIAAVKYQVYLNDAPLAETTDTFFRHAGLAPGTAYSYRIGASDASGSPSPWSAPPLAIATPPTRWYVFDILVPTDTAPSLFNVYSAVPLPEPYTSKLECESAFNGFVAQLAGAPPPGPNAAQRFACIPI